LNLYLREIKDGPLLSAGEERELAEAIAKGDRDARARMIQANLRLVVKIINTSATIRLPAHMINLLTKWRRSERALTRERGCAPTADQVAVDLGLTDAQRVLVEKARRATQLRHESGTGEGGVGWSADEASETAYAPDATLEADDERKSLLRRMQRLDERERSILTLRFGLEGEIPLTLKEVGKRLGVTREWVRKIEIRAVRKLDDSEFSKNTTPARGRDTGSARASKRHESPMSKQPIRRRTMQSSGRAC
jgi:RNA polymerase primary sigma factor